MYQRSRKILFFLVVMFSAVTISCGVLTGEMSSRVLGGKLEYVMKDLIHSTKYQRNSSSLALMSALSRLREILTF
jgi:hypothetical protein